ncbi:hypothetical protein CCP3SC5AM1_310024 [Gammaproteobacteria bacterium]
MERCPACRATLTNGSTTCRRCGCELASVMATNGKAEELLRTTMAALAEGENERAANLAAAAANLRRTPLAIALVGFAEWSIAADGRNKNSPPIAVAEKNPALSSIS